MLLLLLLLRATACLRKMLGFALSVGLLLPLALLPPGAVGFHDVVNQLAAILDSDAQVKAAVQYTLTHVPTSSPWGHRGRDLQSLYAFLDEWANAPVVPSDDAFEVSAQPLMSGRTGSRALASAAATPSPTSFVMPMWALASSTPSAIWLREPKLLDWLANFVGVRGTFMDSAASWTPEIAAAWWKAVNRSEYVVPAEGFTTFNGFFTRQVCERARAK